MKFNEYLKSFNDSLSVLDEAATIDSAIKSTKAGLKKNQVKITQFGSTDTEFNFTLTVNKRFSVHMFTDFKTGKVRNVRFENGSIPDGGNWSNWLDLVNQFNVSGDSYIKLASAMQGMSMLIKQIPTVDDPEQALDKIIDELV